MSTRKAFYVEHWIINNPRELVETYGPYNTKEKAEKFAADINGPDSYDGKFQWNAVVVEKSHV